MKRKAEPFPNLLQTLIRTVLCDSGRAAVKQADRRVFGQNTCLRYVRARNVRPTQTRRGHCTSLERQPCRSQRALLAPGAEKTSSGRRWLATVRDVVPGTRGPLEEYNERVRSKGLQDDEHQRSIVEYLQHLHEMLGEYNPPKIVHPDPKSSGSAPAKSFFNSWFGRKPAKRRRPPIPDSLPKGIYMYGDVGSGKTMLMDLFYDTIPPNIPSKTRTHFHNFMQDIHKRLHRAKTEQGDDLDAIPFVAADIAESATVLCFDEFQCTDVADAMILRRLLESLMRHGVVLVTTSNRHPNDLYINGIQRASFVPCINLLNSRLQVLNLDSTTDYRKLPRPPSGVYYHPLDKGASTHAKKWFEFLGDPATDPPHAAKVMVWGREVEVPRASGRAAHFTFDELIGRATGAADYLELVRSYDAFIVTEVPGMNYKQRDWARRFITFIDAVYESHGKLVLTTQVPLGQLFLSKDEVDASLDEVASKVDRDGSSAAEGDRKLAAVAAEDHTDVDDTMRHLMDDLGLSMSMLKSSSIFSGDEERFAFARALSRLSEMGSQHWVERGMGLERQGGKGEMEGWQRVRSRWREDSM